MPDLQLTPHQKDALNHVTASVDDEASDVYLLHGVTGSGKTEVYLQAFRRVIETGRRGIMLVPEIALTPQTIGRFWERFPGRVAVLHSGLTLRERYDEWRNIAEGQFDIVIGSRSAALAPMPDVGLIVVDEEQEWTYKQESPAPRYHARDVAIERARRENAVVVLGSATPDVGTMYSALRTEITLLELPGRITTTTDGVETGWTERPLADVDIVDLRQELMEGNRSIFSRALREAMTDALGRGRAGDPVCEPARGGAGGAVPRMRSYDALPPLYDGDDVSRGRAHRVPSVRRQATFSHALSKHAVAIQFEPSALARNALQKRPWRRFRGRV